MIVQKKQFTVSEFWRVAALPESANHAYELIDGEIVELSPKLEHGLVASVIHGEIYAYLKQSPIGRAMFKVDHYLPADPLNTRRPDVSFISIERLKSLDPDQNVPLMPDLAVEVKSASNYYAGQDGLREKAAYYLKHGSRLVWLVDPDKQQVEVHRADAEAVIYTLDDTLNGDDVLPGFTLTVRTIFES